MATIDRTIGSYHDKSHARIRKIGRMVGPASYTNPGGDPVTPASLGLGRVEVVLFEAALDASNANPRTLVYNTATGVVRWFVTDTGVEVANATNLSGFSARFEAIGYD